VPRDRNLLHAAAFVGAVDPWHPGVQVGFILKEIQMAPLFLCGVIRGRRGATHWAGKGCTSLEIDGDVKTIGFLAEGNCSNLPRGVMPRAMPKSASGCIVVIPPNGKWRHHTITHSQ